MPEMTKTMAEAVKNLPKFDAEYLATSKYYKGGFDQKVVYMHALK
jgi:DnaJ homolog subfamily C member 19